MYINKQIITLLAGVAIVINAFGTKVQDDPVMKAMKYEIDRNASGLKIRDFASPFFIGCMMSDLETLRIEASLGSLYGNKLDYVRRIIPTLFIGDYQNNNNNFMGVEQLYSGKVFVAPYSDNEFLVRTSIWGNLDGLYKKSIEQLEQKKSVLHQKNLSSEETALPDYTVMPSVNIEVPVKRMNLDRKALEKYVCEASAVFRDYPQLTDSRVVISAVNKVVRNYNTENTVVKYPDNSVYIDVYIKGMTPDGQLLENMVANLYRDVSEIPDIDSLKAFCREIGDLFVKVYNAPIINEPYDGPILIEGDAVVTSFIDNFFSGTRNLIARRKTLLSEDLDRYYPYNSKYDDNQLEQMMNKRIISKDLNITSLTGTPVYNGINLVGYYPVDLEGVVPDKEMILVENGILKAMLNGRTPTLKNPVSNGHYHTDRWGMSAGVYPGVVRLSGNNRSSKEELKKRLLNRAKDEGYDYAYILRKKSGNKADELYQVDVKTGKEQLVRGGVINDLNMKSFKRVLGISDKEFVKNMTSGSFQSSFILPETILLGECEIVKDNNLSLVKPFIVPRPD